MNVAGIPAPRKRRKRGSTAPAAVGKAAIYVRVSTDEQADPGLNGGSLESQETACRAHCANRRLEVVGVFVDGGQSGGTLDRPALTTLREVVAAGKVSAVVVYAIDRLSRRQADTLALLEEFERHGAGLTAASQAFDTTDPAGRALLGMLAVFAELQRAEIRARTKVALQAKRKRGEFIGRPSFGIKLEGSPSRAVPDPDTWPVVARILSERGGGASCQAIADHLNAERVPTATASLPETKRAKGRGIVHDSGQWHAATVAKLCRNPDVLALAGRASCD